MGCDLIVPPDDERVTAIEDFGEVRRGPRFVTKYIAGTRQPPPDPAWAEQRERLALTGLAGSPQFVEVVRFLLADGVSGVLAGERVGLDASRLFLAGIVAKAYVVPHAVVADSVVARAVEFVAWQADPRNVADPHGPKPDWWPRGY